MQATELKTTIAPLKADRLKHQEIIHRLKFEEVIAEEPAKATVARENAEVELSELQNRIAPLQAEINQIGRQFWVERKQVVANEYDLSASKYRNVEQDGEFFENPAVTLDRLRKLEAIATSNVATMERMLTQP